MEELFQMRGKSPTVLLSLDLPEPGGVARRGDLESCLQQQLPLRTKIHGTGLYYLQLFYKSTMVR